MKRQYLIQRIIVKKEQLGITLENLAKLSGLSVRTLKCVFANKDIKLGTIEKISNFLELDFAGNEVISLQKLKKQRAKSKAMASLVQDTSALEMQGLNKENVNNIISMYKKEFLEGRCKDTLWVA